MFKPMWWGGGGVVGGVVFSCSPENFFNIVQFDAWGVLCNNDDHIFKIYNFEQMFFKIANFKINNVSNCVFFTDRVTCSIYVFCKKIGKFGTF